MRIDKININIITFIVMIIILTNINFQTANAQMFWNQTASFAGNSASYVSIPNSSSIDITGSFSFEAWINPSSLSGASKGIVSKGGVLGTSLKIAVRLQSDGRLSFITNGTPRLFSKVSTPLSINKWTHIAATYNASLGVFKIYLNGSLDTSSTIAGAAPTSNTDSLYLGISGASTPFAGQLDEVRLWDKELSGTEVNTYYRTSMAEVTGVYNLLIMSMTFQDENSLGADFNTRDISGNGNNGNARNITAVDQSNNPYSTIHNNESVQLNGTNSYLTGKDTSTLDASNSITVECWVYPVSNAACSYVSKGEASRVYFLGWDGTKVIAKINNTTINVGNAVVPLNQWSHLALVYKNSGPYNLFLNGISQFAGFSALGNITNSSDSLYIGGGSGSLTEFTGYIDEVRISKDHFKSNYEILTSMYNSVDAGNDPDPVLTNIAYNLDGLLVDNVNNGGPKLRFVGGAKFSHPATTIGPVSPVTRDEFNNLSKGYYTKTSLKPVPNTVFNSLSVTTSDTININQNITISDFNLFVAINHYATYNLDITLIAPNGDSVKVFANHSANTVNQGLVTIFDDQADSSLSNSRFTTFSPVFKPVNSLNSVLSGDKSQGKWIIKVTDNNLSDAGSSGGILYAWGFQLNNQIETKLNLNIRAIMQGFYNPSTDLMIRDTMRIYIREQFSPYSILDSSIALSDSTGLGLFTVDAHLLKTGIQVQLKHRNSIETWTSGAGISIQNNDILYRFSDFASRAFGNNQTEVDDSPPLFGIYSGDINQDGTIDASDLSDVDNDALNSVGGYVRTDVTGDDFVDAADVSIVDNNAFIGVSAIVP